MGSGCILGWCPICDDEVTEGEWSGLGMERYGIFVHPGNCFETYKMETTQTKMIRNFRKEVKELSDEVDRLTKENAKLNKEMLKNEKRTKG